MVLTQAQQKRLSQRLDDLNDVGGVTRVAEMAKVSTRVIQKAQEGRNVRVDTMESIMAGLLLVEAERMDKVKSLTKALA